MSFANYLLTEEKLLCCICLDVFTDPVTLPCGHNFCKDCITKHLNFNGQRRCPMCKEYVDRKFKLGINTFISEMAVQFRQSSGRKVNGGAEQDVVKPGQISCDVPAGPKRAKNKFCFLLTLILVTFCFITYMKLHQSLSGLKIHLSDALEKVADNTCSKHDRPLELYCKNEQTPICQSCVKSSHRFHHVVSLKEEYEEMKTDVEKNEADLQQMIQERQLKVLEIMRSLKLSKEAAEREAAHGVQVFASLKQSVDVAQAELFGMIEERQQATEKQAEGFIHDLLLEISELGTRLDKVEQLSRSKDPLYFLRNFPSLNADPPTKDWTEVSICPASYERVLRTALVRAVDQLTETVTREMMNLREAELEMAQQNAVDVTLDPDTAHPALILSDDGKRVQCCDEWKKLPDASERFEPDIYVVGKQSFSCGKFHYDVQVKGKTEWTLGVAKQSVDRKGQIKLNPENGYWTICLKNGTTYFALDRHPAPLSVDYHPETVKVFVDYEQGLVSFYDVDAAALLYSFTGCSFTEKLYPFFSPGATDGGRNAAPLIISPVDP